MTIISLSNSLMPLYFLVFLGIIVGRVTSLKTTQIAELLIYLLSPSVVFYGAYKADLTGGYWSFPMISYMMCTCVAITGLKVAKKIFTRNDGSARMSAFSISTGNTGYFGIPATLAILGPESLPAVVMFSFGFTLFESTIGYYILQRHTLTPLIAFKRVLRLPAVYAFFIGIICNLVQLPLPDFGFDVLNMLRITFSVMGMMLIGIALSGATLTHIDIKLQGFTHIGKFIIVPLIGLGVIFLDTNTINILETEARQVFLIQCMVPLAANVAAFAAMFNLRPQSSALAVMVSTCIALFYLPVGLYMLLPLLPN